MVDLYWYPLVHEPHGVVDAVMYDMEICQRLVPWVIINHFGRGILANVTGFAHMLKSLQIVPRHWISACSEDPSPSLIQGGFFLTVI